jgi:hypothetical protein
MKDGENIPELDGAGFDADGNDNYQPNKYYNQFKKYYHFDAYGEEKFLEDAAIAVTDKLYHGDTSASVVQATIDNIIDLIRPILEDYKSKNNTQWKT